jgi:hypothetical protein
VPQATRIRVSFFLDMKTTPNRATGTIDGPSFVLFGKSESPDAAELPRSGELLLTSQFGVVVDAFSDSQHQVCRPSVFTPSTTLDAALSGGTGIHCLSLMQKLRFIERLSSGARRRR